MGDCEDIDLNDPEVQKAAAKIQAGFRGHKTRKEFNREKPDAQKTEADEIADIDLTDPDLANAALKIQAGFRGHAARKQNAQAQKLPSKMADLNMKDDAEEDIDIDLTDPEVNKAAIKIQATFRGHKIRKNN